MRRPRKSQDCRQRFGLKKRPLAGLLGLAIFMSTAWAAAELEKAQADYKARQERLRCQAHPEQGCLTRPDTENEKAQREYQERQERIRRKCTFNTQGMTCQ